MTARNTDIDHQGVKRLEIKINEIDKEIKGMAVSLASIDQQLKSANQIRDLQIQQLNNDSAELWQTAKEHDTRITAIENNGLPIRIKKVEEYFRWIVLLILGAVVTGLLNLILQ